MEVPERSWNRIKAAWHAWLPVLRCKYAKPEALHRDDAIGFAKPGPRDAGQHDKKCSIVPIMNSAADASSEFRRRQGAKDSMPNSGKVPHMQLTTCLHVRLCLPRLWAGAGRPRSYKTFSSLSTERPYNLCCHLSFAISLRELKSSNPMSALVTSEDVLGGQAKIIRAALSCTLSKALQCSLVGTSTSAPYSSNGRSAVKTSIRLTRTERCLSRSSLPICSARAFPGVMTCLMCVSRRPSGVMMTPRCLYWNTLGIFVCPHVKDLAGCACTTASLILALSMHIGFRV